MITENLKSRIDTVAAHFAGNPDFEEVRYLNDTSRSFRYRPTYRKTYLGTYLNEYSLIDPREGKPLLWSDSNAEEYAEVTVYPVYRNNGTEADVSVGIAVYHCHSSVATLKGMYKFSDPDRTRRYAEVVAAESPFDYVAADLCLSPCTGGTRQFKAKIVKTAKGKAIANAVSKAMDCVTSFEPRDWSGMAKNPSDYHADTSKEYSEWHLAHPRRRGNGAIPTPSTKPTNH